MVAAALRDVRPGIVPFATVTRRPYPVDKIRKYVDFAETVHLAETAAFGEAMTQVAEERRAELKDMPVRATAVPGVG